MSGATANGDELVAIYDEAGVAIGRARRAEVRDQGLWHAGGMVLVRSLDGESVYVHQPEEIVSGQWLALDELQRWANDPRTPLVPDGRLCIQQWFHLRK